MKQCRLGCIHEDACRMYLDNDDWWNISEDCPHYKDKSLFPINIKYNIGDIVYVADCFYGEHLACKRPYIVKTLHIVIEEGKQEIKYVLANDLGYTLVTQDCCFSTYAECTKWCEEHNKISYTLPS